MALPLKRNRVLRSSKEGAQETMKDPSTVEKGEYWDYWKEDKLLSFPYNFSFRVQAKLHLVDLDCASRLSLCCAPLLNLLGPSTQWMLGK
jgi:hypothetical protein